MRRVIITLLLVLPLITMAQTPTLTSLDAFYKQSKEAIKKANKEKTFEKKSEILLELETQFTASLNEFEKSNPDQASEVEKEISLLFETLEPAFILAKESEQPTAEKCGQAKLTVESGDSMGRGENPPLTQQAKEALAWIKVFCK